MKLKWIAIALVSASLFVLLGYTKSEWFPFQAGFLPFARSSVAAPLFEAKLPPTAAMPLPPDSGFVNVREFGAKGDGVTDDTAALKAVFGRGKESPGGTIRSIYLPNGTYLVSDTLEWGDKRKHVQGESRDGVIIRLKDNSPGFQDPKHPKKVLQVEFGHGGQNFDQRLQNLTVDVGRGNPGAIGVGYHTNNMGGMANVVIRSSDPQRRGHTGLSLDKGWPGPGLIQNLAVDGFDTGIYITHDQYSMTFEHILLLNQRKVGFVNAWNSVAIRDLKSRNRVTAIENLGKMGLMALVEADLTGGDRRTPAILNHSDGVLFARDIRTEGYEPVIENRAGNPQTVRTSIVEEFVSHPVSSLFSSPPKSLRLPIEDPPTIPYSNPAEWVSVTAFGAKPDDDGDDGAAIQRAIDSGAAVVYLPAGTYQSKQSLRVRGNVRRLFGLNARINATHPGKPAFIVEDGKPEAVAIGVDGTYEGQFSYWIEHASRRTLHFRHGSYINTVPGGKVFIEDTTAIPLVFDRQKVWIRQANTESYAHNPHITNKGGDLWILGLKTEKDRTIIGTSDGGRTEVLGGLLYKNRERVGPAPAFICENCRMSLVYRNKGLPYQTQILERRNNTRKEFSVQNLPATNGRMPLFVSR